MCLLFRLLKAFSQFTLKIRVNASENFDNTLLNIWITIFDHSDDVLNQTLPLPIIENLDPEVSGLRVVVVFVGVVPFDIPGYVPDVLLDVPAFGVGVERVGMVVGEISVIVPQRHGAIALGVVNLGPVGAIDRELDVVGPEAMEVCVGVREETTLQHFVGRKFDSRNDMCGTKSCLFNFGKIIHRISV